MLNPLGVWLGRNPKVLVTIYGVLVVGWIFLSIFSCWLLFFVAHPH